MPVPTSIDDLSTTAGSNSPSGADSPGDGDNYIRSLSAFIAQLRDGTATVGGVKFANTEAADTTTLDWYREGTFTPTLSFGGGSTGITYVVRTGVYTRIGNRALGNLEIVLLTKGSSTGNAVISGLPYSNESGVYSPVVVYVADMNGFTGIPVGYILDGASEIKFNLPSNSAPLDSSNFTSSAQVSVFFDIQVA